MMHPEPEPSKNGMSRDYIMGNFFSCYCFYLEGLRQSVDRYRCKSTIGYADITAGENE